MSTTNHPTTDTEPRRFAEVLDDIRGGSLALELAEKMAELASAVDIHGKAGEIQLTLKLKPRGEGVEVFDTIKAKIPEYDRPASFFFVSQSSGLTRNPVNQDAIPGTES